MKTLERTPGILFYTNTLQSIRGYFANFQRILFKPSADTFSGVGFDFLPVLISTITDNYKPLNCTKIVSLNTPRIIFFVDYFGKQHIEAFRVYKTLSEQEKIKAREKEKRLMPGDT